MGRWNQKLNVENLLWVPAHRRLCFWFKNTMDTFIRPIWEFFENFWLVFFSFSDSFWRHVDCRAYLELKLNQKKFSIEVFYLAVECKKTFLDIIYGFSVIVMRRVAAFKKSYLRVLSRILVFYIFCKLYI